MPFSAKPETVPSSRKSANLRLAAALMLLVAGMTGLSYAAVPLYRLFCQVTGYGGTTQRAQKAPDTVREETVTVRFDANVSPSLQWHFTPAQTRMSLNIGQNELAFYRVKNISAQAVSGTATFNVTPEIAGGYFNKIACFCFQEQRLEPGEELDMPVSFFVDPAMLNDPDASHIREITLSYTFFPLRQDAAVQTNPANGSGG